MSALNKYILNDLDELVQRFDGWVSHNPNTATLPLAEQFVLLWPHDDWFGVGPGACCAVLLQLLARKKIELHRKRSCCIFSVTYVGVLDASSSLELATYESVVLGAIAKCGQRQRTLEAWIQFAMAMDVTRDILHTLVRKGFLEVDMKCSCCSCFGSPAKYNIIALETQAELRSGLMKILDDDSGAETVDDQDLELVALAHTVAAHRGANHLAKFFGIQATWLSLFRKTTARKIENVVDRTEIRHGRTKKVRRCPCRAKAWVKTCCSPFMILNLFAAFACICNCLITFRERGTRSVTLRWLGMKGDALDSFYEIFDEKLHGFAHGIAEEAENLEWVFEYDWLADVQARKTLGLYPFVSYAEDDVRKRYKQLALLAHPDKPGGSEKRMEQLNDAYKNYIRLCCSGGDRKVRFSRGETTD